MEIILDMDLKQYCMGDNNEDLQAACMSLNGIDKSVDVSLCFAMLSYDVLLCFALHAWHCYALVFVALLCLRFALF